MNYIKIETGTQCNLKKNYTLNYKRLIQYHLNTYKYTFKAKKMGFPSHLETFTKKKSVKMRPKKELTTKKCMFESTNLRKARQFYRHLEVLRTSSPNLPGKASGDVGGVAVLTLQETPAPAVCSVALQLFLLFLLMIFPSKFIQTSGKKQPLVWGDTPLTELSAETS